MSIYREHVGRYRIMRHDDLPEAHKEAYRERGVDPDTVWSLIYSTNDLEAAEETLRIEEARAAEWETWKLVDAGRATEIERPIY